MTRDERRSPQERGYDARWRRTRKRYLRDHPLCECDDPNCHEPATTVHHRDGLGPLGPLGHDPANLQALAKRCHDRLTAQLQPGGWHSRPPRRRPPDRHPGLIR